MDADLDLNLRDHHDNVHTTPMMTTTANKQNYRIFTSLNFRSILNSDYSFHFQTYFFIFDFFFQILKFHLYFQNFFSNFCFLFSNY